MKGGFCILITGVVLLVVMAAGCIGGGHEYSSPPKTYTNSEQAINACINEQFVIALDCIDITEGFYWEADYWWQENYDSSMIRLMDFRYEKAPEGNGAQGFRGTQWFKFKALKKGETEITMVYVRWWPESVAAGFEKLGQNVFTVNIQ